MKLKYYVLSIHFFETNTIVYARAQKCTTYNYINLLLKGNYGLVHNKEIMLRRRWGV